MDSLFQPAGGGRVHLHTFTICISNSQLRADGITSRMAGVANSLTRTYSGAQGRPIFICGCGHSGTTLMLRTLRRVDGLSGPSNETNWAVFPHLSHRLDSLRRLEAMISSQCRLVEKSPIHVFHLERLFEARQQCQVILCVRDARDVVASRKARGNTVERSLSKWIKSIKVAQKYSEDTRRLSITKT